MMPAWQDPATADKAALVSVSEDLTQVTSYSFRQICQRTNRSALLFVSLCTSKLSVSNQHEPFPFPPLCRFANVLSSLGVAKGERALVLVSRQPEW